MLKAPGTISDHALDDLLRGSVSMSTQPKSDSSDKRVKAKANDQTGANVSESGNDTLKKGTKAPSDAELVAGVRAGDLSACRRVVERYQRLLYSIAYGFLGERGEADDAVQEVFVRFFEKAGKLRRASALKTYLARSTTNECIDRLRKVKRRKTISLEDLAAPEVLPSKETSTPQERMQQKRLAELIRWGIAQLSKKQQEVVVLSFVEGLDYAEIAKVLGCEEVTARTHLHRARKKLQELLGPRLRDLEEGFVKKER